MRIHRILNGCAIIAVAIIISGHAIAADTIALVSDVSGNVIIKNKDKQTSAKLLAEIPIGAQIDLPAGAKLSMIYVTNGNEYKLSGRGSYQVKAYSLKTISGNAPAKQVSIGGALSGIKIYSDNVVQAALTMRGVKKVRHSLEPLSPSGSITLAEPLLLLWREPIVGLAYQIQLIDSQNKVLLSMDVMGNTFILPQEIKLNSGSYYVWNLTTTTPDGSIITSSAPFRVAAHEIRQQAAKLKPGKNGEVSDRIAFGLWLESKNLSYDARMVWNELSSEFPDQPIVRDRATMEP